MDRFTRMILRGAALPTAAVGVGIALVAFLVSGGSAAAGALVATAVVVAFFLVGQVILARVLRGNPQMAMPVALTLYLAKISVLLGLLLVLKDVTIFDTKVFALTILACTLAWTIAEVFILARSKVLVVDPDSVPPAVEQAARIHRQQEAERRP